MANIWGLDYREGQYLKAGADVPNNAFHFGFVITESNTFKYNKRGFVKRDVGLDTAELEVPFQYISAVPIWQKAANYNEIGDIIGRFESLEIYQNSTAQDFTLELIYFAQWSEDDRLPNKTYRSFWSLENVTRQIRKLKSFLYPQYDGQYRPPKQALMNIGNLYHNVPVRIKDVQDEPSAPFLPDLRAMTHKVTVQVRTAYPLYQAISQNDVADWQITSNDRFGEGVFARQELKPF